MVYIVGAVLSHNPDYNTLAKLIGPLAFHFVSMFIGGFFFVKGTEKARIETETAKA